MDNHNIFLSPFALGLYLGLIFTALALWRLLLARMEFKRYKRHLSDKLEIESDSMKRLRDELTSLKKENENMRVKINAFNEIPERRIQRDLEIYARAEKQMLVNVPGFAPAWENAKSVAYSELENEEAGRSMPKRVFAKLFGSNVSALPKTSDSDSANGENKLTDRSSEN